MYILQKSAKYVHFLLLLLFTFFPVLGFAEETAHSNAHHNNEAVYGLVFVILAVLIGASTRYFFSKSAIPFTVLLLLFGIFLGFINRTELLDAFGGSIGLTLHESLSWASDIDPHLLLFVFLPILIFEAAFNMDLHTFKKTGLNSVILAIPGIVMALIITGCCVMLIKFLGLGFNTWTWSIALMFGAVISATDPVAVVAILKDLGASKKLGTLIEGESLLNDGTSIVIFMVFLGSLIMEGSSDENAIFKFLQVSAGGTLVGLVLGWLFLRWIQKVYNDALIEISAVIAAAYLTYFIAEIVLGVSGVLALVALGLMIGGFGKSRISPVVEHFMEEFWELAGFIANCIIFLIVGVIIAVKTEFTVDRFILLGAIYVIIHISRGLMITLFYPLMRKVGYGINKKEAIVLWYGGLRGALALSLGLIVLGVDDQFLSPEIKSDFFFLISGTVTLTLLVNATTVKIIIEKLGLTQLSTAKKLINQRAGNYLYDNLKSYVDEIKTNRYLKKADWEDVENYLPKQDKTALIKENPSYSGKLAEARIRLLEKEKGSYWHQFKSGLIGQGAINQLTDTINNIIDQEGLTPLSDRKDLEISWTPPQFLNKLTNFFITKKFAHNTILNRLFDSYDAAVSFAFSQNECIELLEEMKKSESINQKEFETLQEEIQDNIIQANTFIRNLRRNHPKIYSEINTRQATRLLVNKEAKLISEMEQKGIIDAQASQKMKSNLDYRSRKSIANQ